MSVPHPGLGRRSFIQLAAAAGALAANGGGARAKPSETTPDVTQQPSPSFEDSATTADILV
ncbi:MAG: twin-arginine translocation signal domain-containing protein, partial [Alphaproteobacteria bacterium]|nr:twin-arginine translocation signal domain-containing protein [Alphaproteobacteria bacterium]